MSKSEQFVQLVQTAAIVESLSLGQQTNKVKPSCLAAIAVHAAMRVNEDSLPESITEACDKLIEYVFADTVPMPHWLIGIL